MVNVRRKAVVLVVVSLGIFLVGAFAALGIANLEQRSFSIDQVHVEAFVRSDGTMYVVERATYTFRGADSQPFTVGSRSFEPGPMPWRITSIAAYEDGEQRRTLIQRPHLFEWDIAPATSGTRTFELRYSVAGAVQVWSDVAELYWNWVGTTSPAIGAWSATVHLPSGAGEVLAWAHGPLQGVLRIDGDTVRSAADRVPEGQHVDNRIVAAAGRFPHASMRYDTERLDAILAEEAVWADEADRERERRARDELRRSRIAGAVNASAVPLMLLGFVAFWLIWRRWGKDPRKPADIGDYWREVPDDPPAVASTFLSFGQVSRDAFAATVMDLARRGHLRIEVDQRPRRLRRSSVEHRFFRLDPPSPEELLPFERRLLDWFFLDGGEISQEEMIERSRARQSAAASFWSSFQSEVKAELAARHYSVRGKGPVFASHAAIVLLLGAVAVAALSVHAWVAGGALVAASLLLAPLGLLHRSRTPAGARRFHEWIGLRRYLLDFSTLDEAPVGHLALWDHYLVAAVALGVPAQLIRAIEQRFPQLADTSSGFATWYASPGAGRDIGSLGAFSRTFAAPAISSFTPSSSSSGGGGGFSSGGGGGGGGGGFGAR